MNSSNRIERLLNTKRTWLTDGGLETTIIFHDGINLPLFASFHLLESEEGVAALSKYFAPYISLAKEADTGFVLDTATWRSGAFWAPQLARPISELEQATREAVRFAVELRERQETSTTPMVVNGVVGPAGDGYALMPFGQQRRRKRFTRRKYNGWLMKGRPADRRHFHTHW